MPRLLPISSTGVAQFERPEEIVSLFEMRAHSNDLVQQIFHADDSKFPESFFNDRVVGERDSLVFDFSVASLVD